MLLPRKKKKNPWVKNTARRMKSDRAKRTYSTLNRASSGKVDAPAKSLKAGARRTAGDGIEKQDKEKPNI